MKYLSTDNQSLVVAQVVDQHFVLGSSSSKAGRGATTSTATLHLHR